MTKSTNPYAPSSIGSPPDRLDVLAPIGAAGDQVAFQMHNSRVVIRRCYQRRPIGRVAFLFSLFVSLGFFLVTVGLALGPGVIRIRVVVLLVFALVPIATFMGIALLLRAGWRKAIRQTPGLLEPTKGLINQLGVQSEQEGCKWFGTWTHAYQVRMNKHGVQISGEPWRLVSLIIPWEAFEDEAAARSAVTSVVQQKQARLEVPFLDKRNVTASTYDDVFLPTSPHVTFSGSVTYRHVLDTRAGKRMARRVRIWILVFGLLFVCGVPLFLFGPVWIQPAGLMAAIFSALMLFRMRKNPFRRSRIDEDAMVVRGWVSVEGVFSNTQSAQAMTAWSRYADHEIHESILCLRVRGAIDAWQFLPASLFVSESDFRQACDWAAAGRND